MDSEFCFVPPQHHDYSVFKLDFFSLTMTVIEGLKGSRNKHIKLGLSYYKDIVFLKLLAPVYSRIHY